MKIQNTLLIAGLVASSLSAFGQDNRNYVSPTDPELKIVEKYNNPMRSMWSVGANAGVDWGLVGGGLYAEGTGYFSPKRFCFKTSYAFDISNGSAVSKSELFDYGNNYSNLQLTGIFNFKDEIIESNVSPTVGFDEIERSTNGNVITSKGYMYKSDYIQKVRKTKGFGVSFMNISSNAIFSEITDSVKIREQITLANNVAVPSNGFILPFSTTTIGLSFQMAEFNSTNVKFQYKNLGKYKYKNKLYKIINFELLFAPSVRNDDNITFLNANGIAESASIQDIKKNRIGGRITISTNKFRKFTQKPGFYMNGEFGIRPGVIALPLYMRFGLGFAF
jgi:hypothetical protein